MKKRNSIIGLLFSGMLIFSGGIVSKNVSVNAGYCIAAYYTNNPKVHAFATGAGGAAGGIAAAAAGAKIGGKIGAAIGGPIGVITCAGLGAL